MYGEYQTAEGIWKTAVAARPDNPRAYNNLGTVVQNEQRLDEAVELYRKALETCTKPVGVTKNTQANAFTMVNCAPTKQESYEISKPSFEWYPKRSVELVTSVAAWLEEMKQDLGTYDYLGDQKKIVDAGLHNELTFDYLHESKAVLCGDPDEVTRAAKEYEAAGVDLLLCLINPWNVTHEQCMQTIELMGKYVLPEFN